MQKSFFKSISFALIISIVLSSKCFTETHSNIKFIQTKTVDCFIKDRNATYSQKSLYKSNNILDVPVVSEETDDGVPHGICWAACTACIVNYKYHYNLTAANVCNAMGGDYSGASLKKISGTFNHYSIHSTVIDKPLSFAQIRSSIDDNNPVIMASEGDLGHHVTVIMGYIISSQGTALQIMDPQYGFKGAFSSGNTFYYYSGIAKMPWCKTIVLN